MANIYILTWNGSTGKILANGDIMFDLDFKPDLPFPYSRIQYDSSQSEAYLETAPSNGLAAIAIGLTPDQIEACNKYCDSFIETQDYMVYAYDSEYVFRGHILKSKAVASGMRYTIVEGPTKDFSKFSTADNRWYPVFAVFKEDGYPIFDQDQPTDDLVLMLTVVEWNKLPTQPSAVYSLNMVTMTWEDKRELDKVKFDAIQDVRSYFEHYNVRNIGRILASEIPTYLVQLEEARAFLKDANASTPFLDGFLSENDGQDKKALCERIVADYEPTVLMEEGKKHGKMYKFIYRIKACTANHEVDEIIQEVYAMIGKYRILNIQRKYPADFAKQIAAGTSLAVFSGGGMYHGS